MAISNLTMRPAEDEMITAVNAMQRAVGPFYPEISKRQPMRPAEIELVNSVNTLRDKFDLILGYLTIYGKSTQDGTPTPENPVPINIVNALTLKTYGKNLLPTLTEVTTVNGVTFTPNTDGSVTIVGTATANTSILLNTDGRLDNTGAIDGGAGLTLSGAPNGSTSTYSLRVLYYTNANGGIINHTAYINEPAQLTRTNNSWRWVNIYIYVASGATVDATIYPQLECGVSATTYEPYRGTSTPIDLQGNSLHSLPDGTKDELSLEYVDGDSEGNTYHMTLTQRISAITLTGSSDESWTRMATNTSGKYRYRATVPEIASGEDIPSANVDGCLLSPTFANIPDSGNNGTYNCVNGMNLRRTNTHEVVFYNSDVNGSAVTDWRNWVANNNIDLIFKLATPVTHDLGTIELPDIDNVTNLHIIANDGIVVEYDYDYAIRRVIING